MSSSGACGRDPVATLASPWAAGEVAQRGLPWAAWRRAWRPAKAVLVAAELLVRCVEMARRLGRAVPGAAELVGREKQRQRVAAPRGERNRHQQGEEWVQGELRRPGGAPIGGGSIRWAEKPVARRLRQNSEEAGGRR